MIPIRCTAIIDGSLQQQRRAMLHRTGRSHQLRGLRYQRKKIARNIDYSIQYTL